MFISEFLGFIAIVVYPYNLSFVKFWGFFLSNNRDWIVYLIDFVELIHFR